MPFTDFEKLTFTTGNLEQNYTVPGGTRSIAFQAVGGKIDMRLKTGTGTNEWPLNSGDKETISGVDHAGDTFYFTGVDGAVLHIRPLVGRV